MKTWMVWCSIGLMVLILVGVAYSQRDYAYKAYQKYVEDVIAKETAQIRKEKEEVDKQYEQDKKIAEGRIQVLVNQVQANKKQIQQSQVVIGQLTKERDYYKQETQRKLDAIIIPKNIEDIKKKVKELGFENCN